MRALLLVLALAACKGNAKPKDRDAAAIPVSGCKGTEPAVADAAGLAFFNSVGGSLDIELTEAPVKISPNLENQKAPPTATIKSVKLDAYTFSEQHDLVPLTAAERDRVVFRGAVLRLQGFGAAVTHTAADCELTVGDVLDAVEATELQTRGDSDWFEGIDVHHVFFEGLSGGADGVWQIDWGS